MFSLLPVFEYSFSIKSMIYLAHILVLIYEVSQCRFEWMPIGSECYNIYWEVAEDLLACSLACSVHWECQGLGFMQRRAGQS